MTNADNIREDALAIRVLDKVELAVRRAIAKNHLYPTDVFEAIAEEIHKISKDLYNDRS